MRHHVKYDSDEKIILLCKRCHTLLHQNLRREGRCKIAPKILQRKSLTSSRKDYPMLAFRENIDKNIRFIESIWYNKRTGSLTFNFRFESYNGLNLKNISEV